jgi:small subunit ribosomal protein S9
LPELPPLPPPSNARATGRRKSAIARVRIQLGGGSIVVNGKTPMEHFCRDVLRIHIEKPLEVTECMTRYDIIADIKGGGPSGQAGALSHGIARAIEKMDPSQRDKLKKAGLLTRDSRVKERKKYGQKGARARFQFSKR